MSFFPLLLFAASLLGRLTADETQRTAVLNFVFQLFPERVDLVRAQLEAIGDASLGLSVAGTAVIFWVSLGVFRAISSAVNHAWDVEERPGFLRSHVVAFTMLMGAGLLLILSLAWVSAVGVVRSSWFATVLEIVPGLAVIRDMPARYPALVSLVVVVGLVLYFVPNTRVRFRDVWVGAIVTGLLWQAGLAGFSWYLRDVANLSLHGSIATVVTFLFWVYTSAVIFLFGVEFTAAWIRDGEGLAPESSSSS